jgi:hypothetical protein
MPTSGGGFEQSYNAQAGVDMDSILIVETHINQQTNDKREIKPAIENLATLPDKLDKVEALVADTGYFSKDNLRSCEHEHITPYIATERDKHNQSFKERLPQPQQPLPEDADPVTKMKHRLKTNEGKRLYAKRKSTVEPVIGIIKAVMGFRQFLLRSLESVNGEWNLVCIAYNLKRLHALST